MCQSRKKISFSKINLLNLRKNLVGPWVSTQLGERSPKPVSRPKSDTRKVSRPSGPQNHPTCTCTPVPRVSARELPLVKASPYTFFIGSKSWALLSSEPPRGDSSATESRFTTSWVIASPQRKRLLKSEFVWRSIFDLSRSVTFAIRSSYSEHSRACPDSIGG